MSKKILFFPEAEKLYITEHYTIENIAKKLNINEKTIRNWKKEGSWDIKKAQYLKEKQSFHEELYIFARKLMQSMNIELEIGEQPSPQRLNALAKIIPLLPKTKEYEELSKQQSTPAEQQKSPEEILKIVRNFLEGNE